MADAGATRQPGRGPGQGTGRGKSRSVPATAPSSVSDRSPCPPRHRRTRSRRVAPSDRVRWVGDPDALDPESPAPVVPVRPLGGYVTSGDRRARAAATSLAPGTSPSGKRRARAAATLPSPPGSPRLCSWRRRDSGPRTFAGVCDLELSRIIPAALTGYAELDLARRSVHWVTDGPDASLPNAARVLAAHIPDNPFIVYRKRTGDAATVGFPTSRRPAPSVRPPLYRESTARSTSSTRWPARSARPQRELAAIALLPEQDPTSRSATASASTCSGPTWSTSG